LPFLCKIENFLPCVKSIGKTIFIFISGVELEGIHHGLVPCKGHTVIGYRNKFNCLAVSSAVEGFHGKAGCSFRNDRIQSQEGLVVAADFVVDYQGYIGGFALQRGNLVRTAGGTAGGTEVNIFYSACCFGMQFIPESDNGLTQIVVIHTKTNLSALFNLELIAAPYCLGLCKGTTRNKTDTQYQCYESFHIILLKFKPLKRFTYI